MPQNETNTPLPDTKRIALLNGRIILDERKQGFTSGTDAVLLAQSCPPIKPQERIADLGCGSGAAGLCVLANAQQAHLTGIDINPESIALSRHNANLNKMSERTSFINASINDFSCDPIQERGFDHVIMNPPYLKDGHYIASPHESKALACGQETPLEDWIACAFRITRGKGSLTIIHRADHTDQIIQAIGKRYGKMDIIPVWTKPNQPAKRIIIRCWKHMRSVCTLHEGIRTYESD